MGERELEIDEVNQLLSNNLPRIYSKCFWCGNSLIGKRIDAKFCSDSCRSNAHRAVPCEYCGMIANSKDHVVPKAYRQMIANIESYNRKLPDTIPSCLECNSIAGSHVFPTVGAKRSYIQDRIKTKYIKILNMPDWSEESLSELGYTLRSYIEGQMNLKWIIKERLKWQGTGGYE